MANLSPKKRQYTWYRSNPTKKARLDYFLISDELMSIIDKCSISPGYRTDHAIISIKLRLNSFSRGRGFWRFNNSILKDSNYVEQVKNVISKTKKQYAALTYVREQIDNIDNKNIQFTISDQLFFEILLLEIRAMTISHCINKKRKDKMKECELQKEIELLKVKNDENHSQESEQKLTDLNKELETLRANHINGLMIRSRTRWIEEGEKATKYFCSLEKRNYLNKNVTKLIGPRGNEIVEQKDILSEIKEFYLKLYAPNECDNNDVKLDKLLEHCSVPKLSTSERDDLERDIEFSEITKSLKNMKNNKSPGTDGFTTEFFKFFWPNIGSFLYRSYICSIKLGYLSVTQKQGIISIIPKPNKPREYVKNWRPISLLNTSYKILSTVFANRLKTVLDKVIHDDQKGFMKDRFIGENTRLLYDIIQHTREKNISGLLLLVDFEKAFDSISWNYIYKVLSYFNFGPNFIHYIKLLNCDTKLCVIQYGIFSQFFNIFRGCRQGDPISPYLFNLCVEILAILVRNDHNIGGIRIDNEMYKINQYADDTCIYLDGKTKSLKKSLDLLDQFSKYSGLKPNISKTQCIWLGTKAGSKDILCPECNLIWNNKHFTVLGLIFSTTLCNMFSLNFESKLKEIDKLLETWSKRNLTIFGRITVVKTLVLSKITHLLTSIPIGDNILLIQKLERKLYKNNIILYINYME